MTDKEKILKEIERLIEINKGFQRQWKYKLSFFKWNLIGRLEALEGLRNYINGLPDFTDDDLETAALKNARLKEKPDYDERYYNTKACDRYDEFKKGAEWQKERLLKGVISAGIYRDEEDDTLVDITMPVDKAKFEFGERVKAIMLKEDEV